MKLSEFFAEHPRAALAFSGGTDSAYLLYEAVRLGAQVLPCFVKTAFQPEFELRDAARLTRELGLELETVELDVLSRPEIASNPADRCYHCKTAIFSALGERAAQRGFSLLIDGTNASDDEGDRPGIRALREMGVRSPLRECGLTKPEIRCKSKEAGLFTWDKPAYACLATRISPGEAIDAGTLRRVEGAESALFALGFSDLRVRVLDGKARLQLPAGQLARAAELAPELRVALAPYFGTVLLDLEGR